MSSIQCKLLERSKDSNSILCVPLQLCMTIENLYHRVQGCSSVKHSAGIGLLAQAEVVCNFICDLASMKAPKHDEALTQIAVL